MKLSAVVELRAKINDTKTELERLKMMSSSFPSRLDGMPTAKSTTSRVESLSVKILDCECRLTELVEEKIRTQIDLSLEIMSRVTGKARDVLILRYVDCKPFATIIDELKYSKSTIFNLHRRGKTEFQSARG